ncbi:MAG: hypothetical protein HQ534_07130 [Armatimonadetes bacterium]|nr:hypothetical protein [Armatimonadota bacterium]
MSDTLTIITENKDTLFVQLKQHNNSGYILTKVEEENECNWFETSKDLIIGIAWPLTIFLLIIILRKYLKGIFTNIAALILRAKKISKDGIEFDIGTKDANPDFSLTGNDAENIDKVIPSPTDDVMMKKILKTLWTFQLAHSSDFKRRWTFTLGAVNPNYLEFVTKITNLINKGIVAQDPNSLQFLLTDYGIMYCKKNETDLGDEKFKF